MLCQNFTSGRISNSVTRTSSWKLCRTNFQLELATLLAKKKKKKLQVPYYFCIFNSYINFGSINVMQFQMLIPFKSISVVC